ncbi:exopolysaccharide biosynthesis protein [Bosea sp. SSUT16]|jgi:Mrp family chromosome partitioning ATPase|uniref:Exopolysaccharide biosynthesis protein n=1 Tax=Bosea spartocytisi TaxID=2773451 RepID=A0A927HZ85_9HYPH|nr:exopolysaccharide biosynthesis protein [Bosea spartocytisi]MBD3844063.1 exopolysaccharide biosynthesis protein [Bosea spartocytisi]MCT4470829.1 exopolysaccharide biosynthesis protein [Bosea spartocytisi]
MMLGKPDASGAPFRILPLPEPAMAPASDGPVALLRTIGDAGLRHRGKLAIWVAICLAAALAYVRTTPPTYSAVATVLLEPRRQAPSSAREIAAPNSLDLNAADSELQVIRSERLLSTIFDSLALGSHPELGPQPPGLLQALSGRVTAALHGAFAAVGASYSSSQGSEASLRADPRRSAFENFVRRFSARRVGQSYVLEVAYSSTDPALPARVANAAASAYLLQSVAFKADAARSGAEFLQGRVDALAAQVRTAEAAVRSGALPAQPIPDADARIIGAAQTPLGPSAPRSSLIMAFAGVFSLLSGLFVAALAAAFDRRVRLPQDLVRETGLPCLAVVPQVGGRRQAPASDPDKSMLVTRADAGSFASAIRDLQTAIEIAWAASRFQGSPVVAIGSWRAGAGATLLTMNLAQLINHRGRQVSVISQDGGRVHAEQGKEGASLTDVIASGDTAQADYVDIEGVHLLPIRSATPQLNRFVDFRDPSAALVFAEARQRGEVLIDLPPLGESSDAVALATHADIVVLVAAEGVTTHDELNEALGALRRAGATVVGAVINRSRS